MSFADVRAQWDERIRRVSVVMGIPVVNVKARGDGYGTRGFVSDERPVLAYRGFGSWGELKDAVRAGAWKATPIFSTPGEGDTQMALRLSDVLKGSGFHSLRGTGFLGIMEADIRGLPWASHLGGGSTDNASLVQTGEFGLYVNPATRAGVMYPDLGLGIGIVGPIPLGRITTIYEVEDRRIVRSWPFNQWESHIDRVRDNPDWSHLQKIKISYPTVSKKALVHALTMNQDRTICNVRLGDVKREVALVDPRDLWTRPETVRNFWSRQGTTFSIRESQRCPRCFPSMWEAEQLHRVAGRYVFDVTFSGDKDVLKTGEVDSGTHRIEVEGDSVFEAQLIAEQMVAATGREPTRTHLVSWPEE